MPRRGSTPTSLQDTATRMKKWSVEGGEGGEGGELKSTTVRVQQHEEQEQQQPPFKSLLILMMSIMMNET